MGKNDYDFSGYATKNNLKCTDGRVIRKDALRWGELKSHIKEMIFVDHIFTHSSFINNTLHIEDLLVKSINDEPTKERIQWLMEIIIEHYRDFNFDKSSFDTFLEGSNFLVA